MDNELLTIQQVAQLTGLTVHTLRYYEGIGLLNAVTRADNGHRRYSSDDIRWITFLIRLRDTGMPIQQMQQYAEYLRQGAESIPNRIALLAEHQRALEAHIEELQRHHSVIRFKIDSYEKLQQPLSMNAVCEPFELNRHSIQEQET
ncbi:MAG: MerR family transcriptional regulator [Chitinophagaceae bacterium]|nr:MerR family transcriptional regulator [Anaerolineae bacterium]